MDKVIQGVGDGQNMASRNENYFFSIKLCSRSWIMKRMRLKQPTMTCMTKATTDRFLIAKIPNSLGGCYYSSKIKAATRDPRVKHQDTESEKVNITWALFLDMLPNLILFVYLKAFLASNRVQSLMLRFSFFFSYICQKMKTTLMIIIIILLGLVTVLLLIHVVLICLTMNTASGMI